MHLNRRPPIHASTQGNQLWAGMLFFCNRRDPRPRALANSGRKRAAAAKKLEYRQDLMLCLINIANLWT